MSETPREWKHLEPRPKSNYRQLFLKGTRIRAEVIYGMTVDGTDPACWMTPEQIAQDMNLPPEAVLEAIDYCRADPPEVREDHQREQLLMEATGMKDPGYAGKPRPLGPEDRTRIYGS